MRMFGEEPRRFRRWTLLGGSAGFAAFAFAWLMSTSAPATAAYQTGGDGFTDITEEAGIDFELDCGGPKKEYIFEAMCGGIAFIDFDNDGWVDIFLLNGTTLEKEAAGESPPSKLYRNNGDGTFSDVSEKAGIDRRGWGMGVAVGDYDNDGWDDLYLTYFEGGALYRNNGDGTFEDVTSRAGVSNPERWGTSAAFADYDNDGHLDLYVANYVQLNRNRLPAFGSSQFCQYRGIPVSCGPRGLLGSRDRLYHNNGDGTFADVAVRLGIDRSGHYGLGVVWGDYDNDGDQDIYVANDSNPSELYRNNGDGTFEEVGLLSGVALSENGFAQAGMGADFGDYDNDGRLDLVKTNFSDDTNNLYRNLGGGMYEEAGGAAGTAAAGRMTLGFGVRFFDFDNDGWKDIFVANGHVNPQMEALPLGISYAQRNLLFRNTRDGSFEEVSRAMGDGFARLAVSRGAATADIDNDGDLDLLVSNLGGRPALLRNTHSGGRSMLVKLIGKESNRNGIGARIEVTAGESKQVSDVRFSSSYLSSHDSRTHFGLGEAKKADSLIIRWPSGTVEKLRDVSAGQIVTVVEGEGIVAPGDAN